MAIAKNAGIRPCNQRAAGAQSNPNHRLRWQGILVCTLALACCSSASAQSTAAPDLPRTTYGEIGLLDMPSARMANDGTLSLTAGGLKGTQRYNLGFQILPWLEASFRFSHILNFRGSHDYYDRSFGLKLRLFQETEHFPEISLGARDLIGTGIYGAEYLVASKRLSDFDLTMGFGWGRLSENNVMANPFALLFPSFKVRGAGLTGGGQPTTNELFRGPKLGIFGGVIWKTPIDDLDLILEYSSDHYSGEVSGGSFKTRLPVNVGLSYRLWDSLSLSAGWFYGTSLGLSVSLSADPTVPTSPVRLGPTLPAPVIRSSSQQIRSLEALLAERDHAARLAAGGRWVSVPADRPDAERALYQALVSEAGGVHDVEINGPILMVNTRQDQDLSGSCQKYARIVRATNASLRTVAVANLDQAGGPVSLCNVSDGTWRVPARIASAWHDPALGSEKTIASASEVADTVTAIDPERIETDVAAQSIAVENLLAGTNEIYIYYRNTRYNTETEAAGRVVRVLMNDAPADIEMFRLFSMKDGLAMREIVVSRSAMERAAYTYGSAAELGQSISLVSPPLVTPEPQPSEAYPRFAWAINPGLRESLFDPRNPLQVQVVANLWGQVNLAPGLDISADIEANIFNNFDVVQNSDSLIPHVRSDINLYYRHGINGIAELDTSYKTRLSRNLFAEVRVGYLENMFAGAGAQLLWRPDGERFAVGADLYQVWQRNFDRLVGLQKYHVTTGHVSVYYESPWYGLNFNLHVGRYLAGDYGATFEITRRFSTGVEIGAFATLTNVPFAKFGEGSFDKGIIIHIPFEWGLPFYSQSSYDLTLRSLTRDGGQRLDGDDSLYQETLPTSYGEMTSHIENIATP